MKHCYELLKANLALYNGGFFYDFAAEPDGAAARIVVRARGAYPARHFVEGALVVQTQWWRRMFGSRWRPRRVEFAHDRLGTPSDYRQAFGAEVTFQATRSAILFSVEDTLWRSTHPDVDTQQPHASHLDSLVLVERHDLVAQVARILRALLPGDATVEKVAAELGLSTRSLQRRLAEHGSSFTAQLTAARLDMARTFLSHSGVTVAEVAARLGFARASGLTRLLRREAGALPVTPRTSGSARRGAAPLGGSNRSGSRAG